MAMHGFVNLASKELSSGLCLGFGVWACWARPKMKYAGYCAQAACTAHTVMSTAAACCS
jgi:hypothetical protein